MPSQVYLNEFNRFDDETLKKLITIGDSILSPMNTELTSVDFASMIDEVFKENGLADRYFPEWKDRSKSDFGRFLVELFALFSDKDFFYINHFQEKVLWLLLIYIGQFFIKPYIKGLIHRVINLRLVM